MKVRRISITNKLILGVIVLFLVSDALLGFLAYKKSYNMLEDQIKQNTEHLASTIACKLDGNAIAEVQPGDEGTEKYLGVSYDLTEFTDTAGVEFIYTIRNSANGGMEYSIDAQIEDNAMIGEEFDDDEAAPALSGTVVSSSEPYTDDWGTHLSAYAPVYADGKVMGAVGVDVSMDWVRQQTSAL